MKGPRIPRATVNRLPLYLQCLESLPEDKPTVSSMELAERIKENAAKVRKDLSFLGTYGVRGSATTSNTSSFRSGGNWD